MGKFDGMLLVSDFDNTLLYTEPSLHGEGPRHEMAERNISGVAYWIANGGYFGVATGRAMPAYRAYHGAVPANAPTVVDNGGAIYDYDAARYLYVSLLPESARAHIRSAMSAFPGVSLELYYEGGLLQIMNVTEWNLNHAKMSGMDFTEIRDPDREMAELPITKALFVARHEVLEELLALAQQQGWREEYELIYSSDHLLEMTAKGANKGSMARRLARELGCHTLICAGDHLNDLPMLMAADRAFCPENAEEAVKSSGAAVVCHCLDGAVGEIIEVLDRELP